MGRIMGRGGRHGVGFAVAVSLLGAFTAPANATPQARGHAAAAGFTGATLSDAQDAPGGLDIKQITWGTDPTTVTLTIQDWDPIGVGLNQLREFVILIDPGVTGLSSEYLVVALGAPPGGGTTPLAAAGIGPNTPHLRAGTATLSAADTVNVSFARSLIGGAMTFAWQALSIVDAVPAPGQTPAAPVTDRAPDQTGVLLPDPVRVAGATRIATGVQSSFFLDGTATGAVLARSDDYPDALGGAALAAKVGGPLLLTATSALDPSVLAEIQRVLPAGGTVDLLGGPAALSTGVEDALKAAGYATARFSASDRFGTALDVVSAGLGDPTTIFLATGRNFPDALAAGAAAASKGAGILLTDGTTLPQGVSDYLAAHPGDAVYAIGGAAAAADPAAVALVGSDRYETAVMVAQTFFSAPYALGIASGTTFADALAAGGALGQLTGPLLLTDPASLSTATHDFLVAQSASIFPPIYLFGGPAAVSATVAGQIATAFTSTIPFPKP